MVIRVYYIFSNRYLLYTNLIYKKQKYIKISLVANPIEIMEIILSFLSRKRDYWEILNSRYKHDYLKNCNFVIHYYLDKYA